MRPERVGRHEGPIEELSRQAEVEVPPQAVERPLVAVVLALVLTEVAASVLDVELGLTSRVEAVDQLIEARSPGHQNETFAGHDASFSVLPEPV